MATRRTHPTPQSKKTSRGRNGTNGTAKRAAIVGPHEELRKPSFVPGDGPVGPHEQAAITVGGDSADPPVASSASARSRGRNGGGAASEKNLRYSVSLRAKLSKGSDFSVYVFSPDGDRGPVTVESIHVGVSRKGESIFDGDVPVGKETKIIPGTKKAFPFSDAQKKELARVVKSKTFAIVSVVCTAPAQTPVTFSIENENEDSKK